MRRPFKLAAAAAATWAAYDQLLRESVLNWGATEDEAKATLPGDELLPDADGVATRAITIEAPPEAIWPWIVQIGPSPRAGVYTYDWIENLFGLNMHSSDRIIEEFQDPQVGETIGLGSNKMELAVVERNHAMVWRATHGNWIWAFVIEPGEQGFSRMISRNRFRLPRFVDKLGMLPMEPGSLVMERKMLLGIRERATTTARQAE
ncbi:MAG: SRPBCC family protein [Solirubrobacterales bacterium]